MLNLNISNSTNVALNNAKKMAIMCGGSVVESEHLLWGLSSVKSSIASKVLTAFEVTDKKIEKLLIERKANANPLSLNVNIDFTPRVKNILMEAERCAYQTRYGYICTEHILFSLLSDKLCGACTVLTQNFNVDINKVLMLIADYLSGKPINLKTKAVAGAEQENAYEKNKKKVEAKTKEEINSELPEVLRDLGIDLTQRARLGKMDPVIGRDKETNRIIEILCRKTKNNPVLIGEAGVGKSAVVEGLAQAIVKGNVPELLKDKIVFSMEIGSLMAGTKYRGSMEEKLKNAIQEITSHKNIIVFIDEIHTLAQAGSHDNELSPADILKPYLARGEMQTIGATTTDEYRKYIEADKALERRFQPILVDEPSIEDAITILKGIRDSYEGFHKVKITDEAIESAVNLSVRYIMDRSLPDKAIDLIDEASSRAKVKGSVVPEEIKKLQEELKETEIRLDDANKSEDYTLAEQWKQKINEIQGVLKVRRSAWEASKVSQTGVVGKEEIAKVVSSWTGVPVSKLTESEKEKLLKLEEILHKRVIGQDEAVSAVARAIRRARAGLGDPNRPIGSFIFLGPTGVGKTELTKALAEAMFDDENSIIRIDMSEYMEAHSVSKMVGSPPGYVGFDDGGQLTEQIRKKPYSVVLFDEIEKAHPDIFNLMLQILDEGRLTDSKGRTVNFKNSIIIMTSNVGVADLPKNRNKLGFNDEKTEAINIKEKLMESLRAKFKPEFLNRVDTVVVFESLKKEEIRKIADILITKLNKKLKAQKIQIGFNERAMNGLIDEGYSSVYGARPLKRVIEQKVEDKLADEMLLGNLAQNSKYEVDYQNKEFTFKKLD